jgi:transglutaminase-like putative cysteine protease
MLEYLQNTYFIDSDSADIKNFVQERIDKNDSQKEKAIKLYYAVRDEIRYDPYNIDLSKEALKASSILKKKYGYCVAKSILLAAVFRNSGLPSRLGFANVKNHLNSKRLREVMQSDEFIFHGYTEVFLNQKWVKCTPAFNKSLCEKAGILTLEFDGENDSIFHPFNKEGNSHMEYLKDHGAFADLPYDIMIEAYDNGYPHLRVKERSYFGPISEKDKNIKFENEVGK